jgi:5-methylcytosine-specific restriction endonuclease McrA
MATDLEKRERQKAYYLANRDRIIARVCERAREKAAEIKAYKQAWQAKNAERIAAKKRVYQAEHRDDISAYHKARYAASPEAAKARSIAYNKAHAANVRAANKAYRSANKHKIAAAKREHQAANAKRLNEISRSYYRENRNVLRPKMNAYMKGFRLRHPEKHAEKEARRRAQKKLTQVEKVDYRQILEDSRGLCGICRKPLDLFGIDFDHIVPLARGGSHTRQNLQATHSYCNRAKGARTA